MKAYLKEFCQRGLVAMSGGPIIMALVYYILYRCGAIEYLTVPEVVKGVLSSSLLAFIAAGISSVYTIDRLPLMAAIGIHGIVLYLDYILLYLFNGWLSQQLNAITIFTICFILGYAVIWLLVWLCIRQRAAKISDALDKKRYK